MTTETTNCPNCNVSAELIRENRIVPLGQRRVEVEDEFLRCAECGEDFYTPSLADQRHRRAIDRARLDDNLLAPAQIRSIREGLGMSQRLFERVLGVGEKTCVRWEMGRVSQNAATDRLIRLIAADRANLQVLASINGIALPDSCFVPSRPRDPMLPDVASIWKPEQSDEIVVNAIAIGGHSESSINDTAEYEAIISAALRPVSVTVNAGASHASPSRIYGMIQ